MPLVDADYMTVRTTSRNGANDIAIEVQWEDGLSGADNGTFHMEWANTTAVREFLASQAAQEVMRALLMICYDRTTDSFKPTVFDNMPGNRFRILVRAELANP